MTENTTLAYIAGFLDADGWITTFKNQFGAVSFNIGIVNRDLAVLQWVQSVYGGVVKPKHRPTARIGKKWSQTWTWNATSECVLTVLTELIPFLRVKREQAELVLEMVKTRQVRSPGCYKLEPEVKARREEIYIRVRTLNQNGPQ